MEVLAIRLPREYLEVVAITIALGAIVVVLVRLAAGVGVPGALLIIGAVTVCLLATAWRRLRG